MSHFLIDPHPYYQVHEYLSGGLHYSSHQEKWILKQLVPNSTAAERFKLKWDSTNPNQFTVNCTSCRFEDLSQFHDAMLTALYGNGNIFQLVTDYIKKLSISHRDTTAPKTCMELVLRAERVYNLLGAPHNVATENQIAVIIQQLPRLSRFIDIERTDSGVGSETSKTSKASVEIRRAASISKSSDSGSSGPENVEEQNCQDCDQEIVPDGEDERYFI